jgi:hypothetical protein
MLKCQVVKLQLLGALITKLTKAFDLSFENFLQQSTNINIFMTKLNCRDRYEMKALVKNKLIIFKCKVLQKVMDFPQVFLILTAQCCLLVVCYLGWKTQPQKPYLKAGKHNLVVLNGRAVGQLHSVHWTTSLT